MTIPGSVAGRRDARSAGRARAALAAAFALAIAWAAAGCGGGEGGGSAPQGAAGAERSVAAEPSAGGTGASELSLAGVEPDLALGETLYRQRCFTCHGAEGRGDGPGAAALAPKPRDFTDAAWQASVSDEQIARTILYGGAAVGKSPMMPAQPDLAGKPKELASLVAYIRKLGGRAPAGRSSE